MGLPKKRPPATPMERQIAHRVATAKRAIPRRDYSAVIEWARSVGRDTDYAMEDFDHRASVLEWVDGVDRETAERVALEQMRELCK